MGTIASCVARGRAYSALGAMLRTGPSEADRTWLESVEPLREAVAGQSVDALAAEHHRVTAFEVFPHEAVFWHPEGLRGGPTVEACRVHLERLGMRVAEDRADHVGTTLGVLGLLSSAEADALADGNAEEAQRMARCAAEWIDVRGAWLPVVLVALQRVGSPLYGRIAELAGELLIAHRATLTSEAVGSAPALPAVPDLLDEERTGFKHITRHLTLPALTGWWISKAEMSRIGLELGLPRGFDSRARMLENLWFTARDHERLPEMLAAFEETAASWDVALARFEVAGGGLALATQAWRERLGQTRLLLERIVQAARA